MTASKTKSLSDRPAGGRKSVFATHALEIYTYEKENRSNILRKFSFLSGMKSNVTISMVVHHLSKFSIREPLFPPFPLRRGHRASAKYAFGNKIE